MYENPRPRRRHTWPIYVFAVLVAITALLLTRNVCVSAWLFDGLVVPVCPDGEPVVAPFVSVEGLRRGAEGSVRIGAIAHYTTDDADAARTTEVRRVDAELVLVTSGKEERRLAPKDGWDEEWDHAIRGVFVLPAELPDGDHVLRATLDTPLGPASIDVPLPVYAPARVHVITDRPLYQPGDEVAFRAVVLRAKDLAPLDGRPGKWVVEDPSGEAVLEEKAAAGPWGVVAGSFPLDRGAPSGTWRVRWTSGGAEDVVSFRVEPFTLPRFRVEASAARPFHRAGDRPRIRGKVVYSSGAPVRGASIALDWRASGAWPPPTEWMTTLLPRALIADASGAFDAELPVVPRDLRGKATLSARITATDAAGDRVDGGVTVVLSEDAIDVSAVTELDDGLVEGFNNRLYLRATTAAGTVLASTELVVRRAWQPSDPGVKTTTDEDGVAALQLDPGPAINVVIPAMPYRPPPRPPSVALGASADLATGDAPSLRDQFTLGTWVAALEPCARFVASDGEEVTLGLRADASGAITSVASDERPVARCIAARLAKERLSAGAPRVLRVAFSLTSHLPVVSVDVEGSPDVPPGLEAALTEAALDARGCVPEGAVGTELPRLLVWATRAGQRDVSVSWMDDPAAESALVSASVARCIEERMSKPRLAAKAEPEGDEETPRGGALGVARLAVAPSAEDGALVPQPTVMLGYELEVVARAKGEEVGKTKLVLRPGQVPDVRLRATPVLAEPGGTVELAILRGPGFSGELPEKLWLTWELGALEAAVDPKTRTARFTLPADARGWFEAAWASGRAVVFVRPKAELAVDVKPGRDTYAPGQKAELFVTTTAGAKPVSAAVGLIGVDASLGQLVALPGPDELARLRPKAEVRAPAFDVLDASALSLGRIRGANAAAATVLRVSTLPTYAELDAAVHTSASQGFEPVEALTDHFYGALATLHDEVRAWEQKAPAGEQMTPALMAKLWDRALGAREAKNEPVTDAYGRRLRLHRLPSDLLALTDPRNVVVDGTRLPEDVESWPAWVAKERP
ncbi:MG2 domain-containing protein [Myxococcota bacterium]|nr:MG2 domain-containing protein [Myxococcota bacterium]